MQYSEKYCVKCGTKLSANMEFCHKCGTKAVNVMEMKKSNSTNVKSNSKPPVVYTGMYDEDMRKKRKLATNLILAGFLLGAVVIAIPMLSEKDTGSLILSLLICYGLSLVAGIFYNSYMEMVMKKYNVPHNVWNPRKYIWLGIIENIGWCEILYFRLKMVISDYNGDVELYDLYMLLMVLFILAQVLGILLSFGGRYYGYYQIRKYVKNRDGMDIKFKWL